ncbi:hypothetical protein B0H19DRAFT_1247437 [Mycena capillaripes]|nr:hypothetical protein B0H19DRAFT_1247437 [Mycena capillaripes]
MVFLQSPAVYARNLAIQICRTHPNGLANGRHGPSVDSVHLRSEVDVWAQYPTELENGDPCDKVLTLPCSAGVRSSYVQW